MCLLLIKTLSFLLPLPRKLFLQIIVFTLPAKDALASGALCPLGQGQECGLTDKMLMDDELILGVLLNYCYAYLLIY